MSGLESLIPKKINKSTSQKKESVFWIEIDKIKTNPFQPRKEFNQKELKELADSIEKYGILQPLIVRKIEKDVPNGQKVEYQLIAGERRLRASKMIGLKEVPVIVKEISKENELPISLVENIQREDLNPLEKALAFKKLIEEFHLTQKEVAKMVGKSRESIANTLRLLILPEEIQKGIQRGEISEGHARALLSIPKEKQIDVYKETIKKKLPVRELEQKAESKKEKKEILNLKKLQDEIFQVFKINNFKIREKNNKIELTLNFNSEKELRNFLKEIKPS
ncbi:MAG TPA: ParB/RepB/Spo0J family partition protein [Candidatus Paceibacterota bacterium]|nr:ParB/RepB/Spo0J family partition protein [Candidatus Pacearchaeota archaeon]HPZ74595.1 ParB/RepB/Spo0J family partition protein [Candidatus Pacearchaeota archaeon]HQD89174.1 ParB/RepB/Spo0J family partition protein [Candidatus Pacearchaeota archaeon]HRR39175.1 ParB/RepB/Spo0J family partition protein [Candidatus Paceibacterota bacterium]